MKKFIVCVLCILSLVPLFCSWIDPKSYDVFSGSLIYVSSAVNTNPTHLSGDCEYYLDTYDGLALTSTGFLLSTGGSYSGRVLVGGNEYPCRFTSFGEFEIQQPYYQNNVERTTWVQYHLRSDTLPSSITPTEILIALLAIASIILLAVVIIGRFL